jgi:glycerol-3-phosphate dehydrogenase (NAD(P)+)
VTLSGPSFAKEAFYEYPTIVNTISNNLAIAKQVAHLFNSSYFKCVPLSDEIGGQILGAFKNVIAIAMGIIYHLYDSANTRAAMLSQGTKEILAIAKTLGGKVETLYEFCGIGDIYLTCTDIKSRNFLLGKMIVESGLNYALKHFTKTVEGYNATEIAYDLVKKYKLVSPMIEEMYKILYKQVNCKTIVKNIISRL